MFTAIVAHDKSYGIGYKNNIPWYIKEDMKHFRDTTTGHVVIMGRSTYESLGKPLPNRINMVISRTLDLLDLQPTVQVEGNTTDLTGSQTHSQTHNQTSLLVFSSPLECIKYCSKHYVTIPSIDKKLFVIGGAQIYNWFYQNDFIGEEYVTRIDTEFECDVQMPAAFIERRVYCTKSSIISSYGHPVKTETSNVDIPTTITSTITSTITDVSVVTSHKIYFNIEERRMLSIMDDIKEYGIASSDRTGTGTKSLFGHQLKFSLANGKFPLMTTRRTFLRGIFEELMFYLRGQTDNKILQEKKIQVWTKNTSREFLDKQGLKHLPVGDMGHSYGFSFRHFGGEYVNCKTNYHICRCENGMTTKPCPDNTCPKNGFDQLTDLINEIKTNPSSRRLRISLWEPNKINQAALPPCLEQYQFYVRNGNLSCMMTQRSSDYFLAGGWNICTGALLTILLADVCDLAPDQLIWNIGDAHIYNNLMGVAIEQLQREPYLYPSLFLKRKHDDITKYEFEDLDLVGYKYHPPIKGEMSA